MGNRAEAFLSIAPDIASYEEYRRIIIDHVYTVKLQHWDKTIRILSSQALGRLAPLDVSHVGDEVVQYLLKNSLDERNIHLRHGSVLGLAETILAFGKLRKANGGSFDGLLSEHSLLEIAEMVPAIEKKRLYRGKDGEQMRAAVCRLIECISIAGVHLTVPQQVSRESSRCWKPANPSVSNLFGSMFYNRFGFLTRLTLVFHTQMKKSKNKPQWHYPI